MFKRFIILITFLLTILVSSFSQTIIGIQDFEAAPAAPTMTFTGGNLATGNGLFPNAPKYVSGTQGREVRNSTTNITFSTVDASAYSNVFFTCRLASFAGTSGNGNDGADFVTVSVSSDGGSTWSQELKVNGNNNAKWSYTSGSGIASSIYDGNNITSNFTPAGGGNRTTDGYSTITVTNLPAVSTLRVRLEVKNNSSNEYWVIDDAEIKGTIISAGPHTVTFNGNGNDGGSMSNQTATGPTALTTNAFTQTGCTFTEWNTASDGSGTSFADGATYSFSADLTLFAQWNCPPPAGGNCIDEDFVDFSDWTNSGTSTDNVVSHAGAAIPCRALGSGDELTSPAVNNPTQLTFYQDASSGGNGNSALVEYSIDGGTTWVTCLSFNVTSAGNTETVNLTNVGGVDLSAHTGVLFKFSASFNTWYLDDVVVTCGVVTNTITTGTVSGSPFSVMCASSASGTVAFTSTDVFTAGNVYTAQLSNAGGLFSSPSNIGTLNSTANSGTINITIPAGTVTGSGYKIRVISSSPAVIGSESATFTINLTDGPCSPPTPQITGILIDACGGNEGIDEFFTFENGASSLSLSNLTADFPNGETYCNSGCGTKTWVTNPTYVAQINTTAGCAGLFLEADPIPAGGKTVVFTGSNPSHNFDFSGLCGTGPYYAVFANNTNPGGRFGNYNADCTQIRTLTVNFGGGNIDAVDYQRCALSNTDGDYVSYDYAGNPTYKNDGCTPTAILPVTLVSFEGKTLKNNTNLITWNTASEINNEYFSIEKSDDAILFSSIGEVNGAGNSNNFTEYRFIDKTPNTKVNYYRLKQIDFNGEFSYSSIIVLDNNRSNVKIFISNYSLQINLDENITTGDLMIFDAIGQTVHSETITSNKRINIEKFNSGIYIVKITTPTGHIVQKVKF